MKHKPPPLNNILSLFKREWSTSFSLGLFFSIAIITSNNQSLRSAGDNDRRSKYFCSNAVLCVGGLLLSPAINLLVKQARAPPPPFVLLFVSFSFFLVFPSLLFLLTKYIWLLLLIPFHWRGIARTVVEMPCTTCTNLYETGHKQNQNEKSFLLACGSISSSRYVSKAPNMYQHKNALKWQCISNLGGIIVFWSHGSTKNKCALLFR